MNKMKYISSDDICVFIKSLRQNAFNDNFEINLLANFIEDYIKHAKDAIVRCKDCKHWKPETSGCDEIKPLVSFRDWDFCSYGERKETE